jgi:hypothetical protein
VSNGGGGGGCTKSPVGTFPASVVTETIPVRATAIKKRFIRLSLLKVLEDTRILVSKIPSQAYKSPCMEGLVRINIPAAYKKSSFYSQEAGFIS